MRDWRTAVLKSLGYKPTKQNLQFLSTWQRWEGGHTNNGARFNWLNTTHGDGESINSVGVKRFRSFDEGIMNTTETLLNGRYQDILDALASGDPFKFKPSAGLQTWVSGRPDGNPEYALKVLGAGGASSKLPSPAAPQRPSWETGKPRVELGMDWDWAMDFVFDDDPEFAELMKAMPRFDAVDQRAQASGRLDRGGSIQPVQLPKGRLGSVIQAAQTQLGKPYVFGSGPDTSSFDCSDLIQWAYGQIGIRLPRTTYDQINAGVSVKGKPLKPGDLVFPHKGHVVMYVGNGKVIAAPQTGTVVQYQNMPKNPIEVRRVMR